VRAEVSQLLDSLERSDYSKLNMKETSIPEKYHRFDDSLPLPLSDDAEYNSRGKGFSSRHYPRIHPGDRTQPMLLARTLSDALAEVEDTFPTYFDPQTPGDPAAARQEIAAWMFVFGESICQVAVHNRPLALLLTAVHDRMFALAKLFVARLEQERLDGVRHDSKPVLTFEHVKASENPYKTDFVKLRIVLDNSPLQDVELSELRRSLREIQDLVEGRKLLDEERTALKREVEKLQAANKRLTVSNFELNQQKVLCEKNVSDLVSVAATLRETISENEQRIFALTHLGVGTPIIQGLGSVPSEVIQIWEQLSHFCKNILSGDLLRLEVDRYFPSEVTPDFARPCFTMKRPAASEGRLHFTTFFTEIKKTFDESRLFLNLELQIRDFLEFLSKRYETRFLAFQKMQSSIAREVVQKLDEFIRSTADTSMILRTFVQQRAYLKIPARGGPTSDVHTTMSGIYHYVATHPLERSVTQTVFSHFGNPNNGRLRGGLAAARDWRPRIYWLQNAKGALNPEDRHQSRRRVLRVVRVAPVATVRIGVNARDNRQENTVGVPVHEDADDPTERLSRRRRRVLQRGRVIGYG
jgi:hypothetical protein